LPGTYDIIRLFDYIFRCLGVASVTGNLVGWCVVSSTECFIDNRAVLLDSKDGLKRRIIMVGGENNE